MFPALGGVRESVTLASHRKGIGDRPIEIRIYYMRKELSRTAPAARAHGFSKRVWVEPPSDVPLLSHLQHSSVILPPSNHRHHTFVPELVCRRTTHSQSYLERYETKLITKRALLYRLITLLLNQVSVKCH